MDNSVLTGVVLPQSRPLRWPRAPLDLPRASKMHRCPCRTRATFDRHQIFGIDGFIAWAPRLLASGALEEYYPATACEVEACHQTISR